MGVLIESFMSICLETVMKRLDKLLESINLIEEAVEVLKTNVSDLESSIYALSELQNLAKVTIDDVKPKVFELLEQGDLLRNEEHISRRGEFYIPCIENDSEDEDLEVTIIVSKNQNNLVTTKLSDSMAAAFYRRHLKKYVLIRKLWGWIWRNVFLQVGSRIIWFDANRRKKFKFTIIKTRKWVNLKRSGLFELLPPESTITPPPVVYPKDDSVYLVSPHESYEFNSVFCTIVQNAHVIGGTNIVFEGQHAICHDLYDFNKDYTSEELHSRHTILLKNSQLRLHISDDPITDIPEAAAFLDACAPNYAHWMTEVLPRISAFCANEKFKHVPLIVDCGLHKNILRSLFAISGPRRIYQLGIGARVKVSTLHLTSVAGYVPFERRSLGGPQYSHGLFSGPAFRMMRQKLINNLNDSESRTYPSKIYLRRNSGVRMVANLTEIEDIVFKNGYICIEPELLSLNEQIRLFMNADSIVASSGAALANIIFAKPSANIIIMIGKCQDTSYWYWQNIACAVGCKVSYVLGKPKHDGIHSDFNIVPTALAYAMNGNQNDK